MIIGITGNIGAGKSTFCKFLQIEGFEVINADTIGKEIIKKGKPGFKPIVEAFGKEILDKNGEINKKKLAKIVFSNREKLKLLNSISHPIIERKIEKIKESSKEKIIFIEAALLIEANWYKKIDYVITVYAHKGQRLKRAAKKFGLKEAVKREEAQLPYKEKLKFTDILICNTSNLFNLKTQAKHTLNFLKQSCQNSISVI